MTADESILEAISGFVGEGVVEFGDLFEWCSENTELDAAARVQGEASDVYLELLLAGSLAFAMFDSEVRRLDLLLDSLVFTHRVTKDEISGGFLPMTPDLAILDWDKTATFVTPSGGEVRVSRGSSPSMTGPDGWLHGIEEESLVAIRRSEGVISVEPAVDVDDGPRAAALVEQVFEALTEYEESATVESIELWYSLLGIDSDVFRTPTRPLGELLEEAGLERRGELVAVAESDSAAPSLSASDELLAGLIQRWGLDECCVEALDRVIEAVESGSPGDPREVAEDLGHGAVVMAFRDWIQREGRLDSPELGSWVDEVIEGAGRSAASALTLRASHRERQKDALGAEADLERAHTLEPDFSPASVELATYMILESNYQRAAALLTRSGADGSAVADLFGRFQVDASKVGRNEPCPCGSGRKFKSCHLGKPLSDPSSTVGALLTKMQMFVTDMTRATTHVPVLAVLAAQGDPTLTTSLFDDPFIHELALFEGTGLDDFIELFDDLLSNDEVATLDSWCGAKLSVWEVAAIEQGHRVVLRDVRSGEEVTVNDRGTVSSVGGHLLARLIPAADELWMTGVSVEIDPELTDSLVEMLAAGPHVSEIAEWYAGTMFRLSP